MNVGDHRARQLLIHRHRSGLGDWPDIEQVVRDALHLFGRDLGSADVHTFVGLHRVGINDFAVEVVGQLNG